MTGSGGKNNWALFLLILSGVVLGGFIGMMSEKVSFLAWLSYGQTFGLSKPVTLDLGVMALTFGITVHISIASIIGVVIAIIIYRKL